MRFPLRESLFCLVHVIIGTIAEKRDISCALRMHQRDRVLRRRQTMPLKFTRTQWSVLLALGTLILFVCVCGSYALLAIAPSSPAQPTAAIVNATEPVVTPAPSSSPTPTRQPSPTPVSTPTLSLTPLAPVGTLTRAGATSTSAIPTAPKPTPTKTQTAATETQLPPTALPAPQDGSPANPWGYNFTCCQLIYLPPSMFCNYFNCIGNFWNGVGYLIQCNDGTFSKSGGRSGSCSGHGGNGRTLYAP